MLTRLLNTLYDQISERRIAPESKWTSTQQRGEQVNGNRESEESVPYERMCFDIVISRDMKSPFYETDEKRISRVFKKS
jgi:hypothetical protein